jgi:hypothetical protein
MKKLMMGLALAAVTAMPALANGGYSRMPDAAYDDAANTAYDYVPGPQNDTGSGAFTVYDFGRYQGADPDPFIRGQLRRESGNLDSGGN